MGEGACNVTYAISVNGYQVPTSSPGTFVTGDSLALTADFELDESGTFSVGPETLILSAAVLFEVPPLPAGADPNSTSAHVLAMSWQTEPFSTGVHTLSRENHIHVQW